MFKYINNLVLALSLIVGGIFLGPRLLFGKTWVTPYIVTSGSMAPAIPSGSVVFVAPSSSYSPGDVITFHPHGDKHTTVTHRLLFTQPRLYTAGDANADMDQFELLPRHIVGKVVFHIPYIGRLADLAKTPRGFIFLVIVPATIIVYEELKSLLSQLGQIRLRLIKKSSPPPIRLVSEMRFSSSAYHPALVFLPIFFASLIVTTLTISYFMDTETSSASFMSVSAPVTPPSTP